MAAIETVIPRAEAKLWRAIDGDTYQLIVNWVGRSTWRGAPMERIRLRDYSAREIGDVAETELGEVVRLSGRAAQAVAQRVLSTARSIHVEPKGESLARDVAWLWVDGQSLGQVLLAEKAVALGRREG